MNISQFMKMTIIEQAAALNIQPDELTHNTYIYVNQDGELAHAEKRDRHSHMVDEMCCGQYVMSSDFENLSFARSALIKAKNGQ